MKQHFSSSKVLHLTLSSGNTVQVIVRMSEPWTWRRVRTAEEFV